MSQPITGTLFTGYYKIPGKNNSPLLLYPILFKTGCNYS